MVKIARFPLRQDPRPTLSRRDIEDMIEALIDLLDAIDPDPDLEEEAIEDDDPPGEDAVL